MTQPDDYDAVAEAVRKALLNRLSSQGGKQFAIVCLRYLARDDRLEDLFPAMTDAELKR